MKFKLYPQLFDKHIEYVKKIDYNRLYYKHKADELKGRSLQKYNDFEESVKLLHKNMRLPKALLFITVYPFLLLFGSIVSALPKAGVRQAYSNAPVLFWLLSILLFLSSIALIFFLYKRKNFIAAMTELNETTGKEVDRVIIEDLNVPSNATKVCFIQRSYYKNKLKPSSVLWSKFFGI